MGGEACRPPAVPTAQPPGQGQGPARVGRGQGELVRGCQAALSQEAGPRPQRKGGSVGGGGAWQGSHQWVAAWWGQRSGRPAYSEVPEKQVLVAKAQAPHGQVRGCHLGLGPGSRVLHLPAPQSGRCLLDGHFSESSSLGPPEPSLVRVYV